MKVNINKKEITELLENEIPKLSKALTNFGENLIKDKLADSLIIVASSKNHPLGGGSFYSNKLKKINDPVTILNKEFRKWEHKNGISTKHDWVKDGWNKL